MLAGFDDDFVSPAAAHGSEAIPVINATMRLFNPQRRESVRDDADPPVRLLLTNLTIGLNLDGTEGLVSGTERTVLDAIHLVLVHRDVPEPSKLLGPADAVRCEDHPVQRRWIESQGRHDRQSVSRPDIQREEPDPHQLAADAGPRDRHYFFGSGAFSTSIFLMPSLVISLSCSSSAFFRLS